MGRAKEIIVKVIPSKLANDFVKKHHYSGKVVQNSSLHSGNLTGGVSGLMKQIGAKPIKGFQIRYIYLIDKKAKLTIPTIPFSKIQEMGAGMYKGKKK